MKKIFFKYNLFYFVSILLLAALLLFFWSAREQFKQFELFHQNISEQMSLTTALEIELLLINLKTGIDVLVEENTELIADLTNNPEDGKRLAVIKKKINDNFPSFYMLTLTDQYGQLLFDDSGKEVGQLCREDIIKNINNDPSYRNFIHPGPSHYHFDIMVPWKIKDDQYEIKNGIFFVSFSLDALMNILKTNETAGHELYLVHQIKENLIELTPQGSRNVLNGINFLDDNIEQQFYIRKKVPNTLWEVIDVISIETKENYLHELIIENVSIFLGLLFFSIFMFYMLHKEEKNEN